MEEDGVHQVKRAYTSGMTARYIAFTAFGIAAALCFTAEAADMPAFTLTSSAFAAQGSIPVRYTCEGGDTSPALTWEHAPAGTKSYALIVDDPDAPDPAAPQTTWVHWVVYDIPATVSGLPEGTSKAMPTGSRDGSNDWQRPGYGGPCPPIGRHRYFHKLYALDVVLPDLGTPDKAKLEAAMQGHVLAKAELMGTYHKAGH
jgi:Raf kinase inhibitor-like YbhB/YbcL family protein